MISNEMGAAEVAAVLRKHGTLDKAAAIVEKDNLNGQFFIGLGKNDKLLNLWVEKHELEFNESLALQMVLKKDLEETAAPSRVKKRKVDAKNGSKKRGRPSALTTASRRASSTASSTAAPREPMRTPAAEAAAKDKTLRTMSGAELVSRLHGNSSPSPHVISMPKTTTGLTTFNSTPAIFRDTFGSQMTFEPKGDAYTFRFTKDGFKLLKDLAGCDDAKKLTPQLVSAAFKAVKDQHKKETKATAKTKGNKEFADAEAEAARFESLEAVEAACAAKCDAIRASVKKQIDCAKGLFLDEKMSAADVDRKSADLEASASKRVAEHTAFYENVKTIKVAQGAPSKQNAWNAHQQLSNALGDSPNTAKSSYATFNVNRKKKRNGEKAAAAAATLRAKGYDIGGLNNRKKKSKSQSPRDDDDDDDLDLEDDDDDDLDDDEEASSVSVVDLCGDDSALKDGDDGDLKSGDGNDDDDLKGGGGGDDDDDDLKYDDGDDLDFDDDNF